MDKSYRETLKPTQLDFWKNLWFYNKKIIIAVVIAVIIAVMGIVSCSRKISPDAAVIVITRLSRTSEATEKLQKFLGEGVEDVTKDGKVVVDITELYLPVTTSEELNVSNLNQVVNEIINGDASIIIAEQEIVEGFFEEQEFLLSPSEGKYPLIYNNRGRAVAVDITESEIAEMIEYQGEGKLCLLIKNIGENSELYDLHLQGLKIVERITGK